MLEDRRRPQAGANTEAGKLLINEEPLQVLPTLAVLIGLNEAIFVQQLHYWAKRCDNQRDGFNWVYNTYAEWQKQFPFWSEATVRRVIRSLEEPFEPKEGDERVARGPLLISTDQYNRSKMDHTKWSRLNYTELNRLNGLACTSAQVAKASAQNEQIVCSSCTEQYQETTQETNYTQPAASTKASLLTQQPAPGYEVSSGGVDSGEKGPEPNPARDLPRLPEADLQAIEAMCARYTKPMQMGTNERLKLRELWGKGCTLAILTATVEETIASKPPGWRAGSMCYFTAIVERRMTEQKAALEPKATPATPAADPEKLAAQRAAEAEKRRQVAAQRALIERLMTLPDDHTDWGLVSPEVARELRLERRHLRAVAARRNAQTGVSALA